MALKYVTQKEWESTNFHEPIVIRQNKKCEICGKRLVVGTYMKPYSYISDSGQLHTDMGTHKTVVIGGRFVSFLKELGLHDVVVNGLRIDVDFLLCIECSRNPECIESLRTKASKRMCRSLSVTIATDETEIKNYERDIIRIRKGIVKLEHVKEELPTIFQNIKVSKSQTLKGWLK